MQRDSWFSTCDEFQHVITPEIDSGSISMNSPQLEVTPNCSPALNYCSLDRVINMVSSFKLTVFLCRPTSFSRRDMNETKRNHKIIFLLWKKTPPKTTLSAISKAKHVFFFFFGPCPRTTPILPLPFLWSVVHGRGTTEKERKRGWVSDSSPRGSFMLRPERVYPNLRRTTETARVVEESGLHFIRWRSPTPPRLSKKQQKKGWHQHNIFSQGAFYAQNKSYIIHDLWSCMPARIEVNTRTSRFARTRLHLQPQIYGSRIYFHCVIGFFFMSEPCSLMH